jgi:hypothetical protein
VAPSFLRALRSLRLVFGGVLLAALVTQCAFAPAARAGAPAGGSSSPPADVAATVVLSPAATRALLESTAPPPRNEPDLVRRYKQACDTPAFGLVPLYRDDPIGDVRTFWVQDQSTPQPRYFQAQATLRYASQHLLFYVQDGLNAREEALAASARAFVQ